MQLKDQAVVISGGASGMGAATARHFAHVGARVAILDQNQAQAQQVADEIGGLALACDVSDPDHVEAAIAEAKQTHGAARAVIICAGICPAQRIVGREGAMPLADFAKVINVNLNGTFNVLRLAAANMFALDPLGDSGERGVIIMTASIAAYEGQIGQVAYSASKGGVVAMTLPAAREFAKFGIRVNTIAPGIIGTPMVMNMPDAVQQSLAAAIPFPKRLGKPEEYAKLAAHIVDNEFINGEVIRLDGAIRMQAK